MLLGSMLFDLSPVLSTVVLFVIAGIALMVAGYLKAPPDTAYVISGLGKKRIR